MEFFRKNKAFICIIFIIIAIVTLSNMSIFAATTEDNMKDLDNEQSNANIDDEYEDIENLTENKNTNTNKNTNINKNTNTNKNTNINKNTNTNKNTTSNTNSLAKAGIEDTPSVVIIAVCIISTIYAYKKIKQYKNI